MRVSALAILLLISAHHLVASDQDIGHELTQKYANKVLTLRHAFKSSSQLYDADGQPVKPGKEGPWTLYGRLQIEQIKEENGELEINARRTGLLNHDSRLADYGLNHNPVQPPPPIGGRVTIHMQLLAGADSERALGKVFALTSEDLLASVPDLWKDYVRLRLDPQSSDGQWEFTPGEGDAERFSKTLPAVQGETSQTVNLKTAGVTPPRPISTAEPEYGGEIGEDLVHGTNKLGATIDEQGRVISVEIINPIGLGVDESTAAAIRKWKFKPGQLNGKPVQANMTIMMQYKSRGR